MKSILLIESDQFRKSFIQESLKDLGSKFFWLDNPSESDFMIRDISPDLIIFSMESFSEQWVEFEDSYNTFKFLLISASQIPGVFTLKIHFQAKM
jgi:hypothetical protein